ncbi:hypothetical protein [Fibrobacter sp.]|nr:hypothetical protein [Fibrobacter sp.]MBR3070570.1 hypothetical protein [Fibrobacter sp.]
MSNQKIEMREKKAYQKPEMEVVAIDMQDALLVGSSLDVIIVDSSTSS